MNWRNFIKAVDTEGSKIPGLRYSTTEYGGAIPQISFDSLGRSVHMQQETPLHVRAWRIGRSIKDLDTDLAPFPMDEIGVARVAAMIAWLLDPVEDYDPQRAVIASEFEATGWDAVDERITSARKQLLAAQRSEQFQAVGLICREILIALAQSVFDPRRHRATDGVDVSGTDAKRMLNAYLETELPGSTNEEARRLTRAAVDFANAVQHRPAATWSKAALSLESTASVVSIIAVVAGRKGPSGTT